MTMRACCRCGKAIAACNGFTIARDQLAVDKVRELCGTCSETLALLRIEAGEAALDAAIRALPHPGERPMKQSEIVAGETYHNGRGRSRWVADIERASAPEPASFEVWWETAGHNSGFCSLAAFARWAKGKVERP